MAVYKLLSTVRYSVFVSVEYLYEYRTGIYYRRLLVYSNTVQMLHLYYTVVQVQYVCKASGQLECLRPQMRRAMSMHKQKTTVLVHQTASWSRCPQIFRICCITCIQCSASEIYKQVLEAYHKQKQLSSMHRAHRLKIMLLIEYRKYDTLKM